MDEKELLNVLMVEDNLQDFRLVQLLLEEASQNTIKLEHTSTIKDAKACLVKGEYNAVILDMNLPDSFGVDAIRQIQSIILETVPIVVLSGTEDDVLVNDAMDLGVQEYIVKGVGDGHFIARSIRYAIERQNVQRHLVDLVHYDKLTGIANRELFYDRLKRALARAKRNDEIVGLMFLDLDRFKGINDSLGHHAGDQLLKEVARRLKKETRETDTVSRLGGDEFTVILEGAGSLHNIATVAKKLLTTLQEPVNIDEHEIFVTSSIGITTYPLDGKDIDLLVKNADRAMYQSKELGRNKYQFYSSKLNRDAYKRLRMEAQMHKALKNDEFFLYYQPKVDIASGETTGAEALIRWRNKELGFVPPDLFIPLAEENGLIIPISEWVLRTTCRQVKYLHGKGFSDLVFTINLSARQFRQKKLPANIDSIVVQEGLSSDNIALEITESILMADTDESQRMLYDLKDLGFSIHLDDFGTGYSSLSYLKKFPIDVLKIDRSFVMDIPKDKDDMAISSAIVAMGKALRMKVVAEGIETLEQYNFLHSQGCDEAQGYLFSKPLPAIELEAFLLGEPDLSSTLENATGIETQSS